MVPKERITVKQRDWPRGERYQRIRLKYHDRCIVCLHPVNAGDWLMWDSHNPGNVFCDRCSEELQIAVPRERTLFDLS